MTSLFRFLVVASLLAVMLAACGGDDDDDPTPTSQDTSAPTETTEASGDATSTESEDGVDATTEETATEGTPSADETAEPSAEGTASAPAAETTTAPDTDTMPRPDFAYGWNIATRGDENGTEHNQRTADMVKQSGFGWVRFMLSWASFERNPGQWDPLPVDRVIDEMNAQGLNILIVVAKAPEWAQSEDADTYLNNMLEFEQFMSFVADRYKGKVQAWEIWNEQNLAHEWGGRVNPNEYLQMLEVGSRAVRAADPEATVVFGGLTPNGILDPAVAVDDLNYLNLMYSLSGGAFSDWFDVLGVHLNSTHNSPDEMYPDNVSGENEGWNDHPSFFFRRAEQLREAMIANGDEDKMMWITEFGWTTENQAPGYEYGVNNSEQDVADYLTRSLEIATSEWDFVSGAFVWNLNWSTLADPSDEKFPWSALNADWSPRPAFEALSNFPKQ